jgi:hypothetical protein
MKHSHITWSRVNGEWHVIACNDAHAATHMAEMSSDCGHLAVVESPEGNSICMWDVYIPDVRAIALPQRKQGGCPC